MRRSGTRFLLAIQFLTIVPVNIPTEAVTREDLAASVRFYPAVGVLLGGMIWLVLRAPVPWSGWVGAGVAVSLYTLVTGAIHLDGLMDTWDALGSRKPPAEALAVMRDSRVGAMGAIAGSLTLLVKIAALAPMVHDPSPLVVLVPAVSRLGMLWAVRVEPVAARPGAPGLADRVAGGVRWRDVVGWLVALAVAARGMSAGWRGVALVGAALGASALWSRYCAHRFGGLTGDIYGAVNEAGEWVGFILLSLQ
jgi:adenosylcobinamide-GDP ribazoletransferase